MGNVLARINEYRMRMKHLTDVFQGRTPRVLIIGLDGAGKTKLMYSSKLDYVICANPPPRGINLEHMRPKRGARIQLYDLPGSKITRHLWHNYFKGSEAIVYVVDASDRVRVDEAKFELHELLQSRHLIRVPLVVVANKQDIDGAMGKEEVTAELDLTTIDNRDWSVHLASAEKYTGIKPAFVDVVDKIKAYRHYKAGLVPKVNTSRKSSKSSESKKSNGEPQFTSIEETVIDEGEKESTNIPSLFENVKKSDKITDLDAESDVVPGPSNAYQDEPEYDRARPAKGFDANSEHSDTGSKGNNPSPDSMSFNADSTDRAESTSNEQNAEDKDNENEFQTRVSIHSSNTDDSDSVKSDHVDKGKRPMRRIGIKDNQDDSDGDCVQNLEDIVKHEEMNRAGEE